MSVVVSSDGKEPACNVGDWGLTPGWEELLEKGMATHSSILAWRITWMEEPDGLYSPWGCNELGMTAASASAAAKSL